ncbi:hypothetical protein QJS10_CPB21g01211 [Acorus calamus]|uniref:Uncharacterized protein n=1 Tax=Acorus calamus TaxID=4465 RepID=A0AAV9C761_ACOCL|nr:hypothetical protein QJS10_CPB21g01211 [Acorus calamus]
MLDAPALAQLDRDLIDTDWDDLFPGCEVLPKKPHKFRFETWWTEVEVSTEVEGLDEVVRASWAAPSGGLIGARRLAFKLKRLKRCLRLWGRTVKVEQVRKKNETPGGDQQDGVPINDASAIGEHLVQHFTTAFSKDRRWRPWWFNEDLKRVPDSCLEALEADFAEDEVRGALFREWQPVIDRMAKRLEGWQGKPLSKNGNIHRRFFWRGTSMETKTPCFVSWDRVCMRRSKGGLGLLRLDTMNKALLSKWCWNWVAKPEAAWVKLIKEHHDIPNNAGGMIPMLLFNCSPISRGFFELWADFAEEIKWLMGDGSRIHFWEDCWCADRALKRSYFQDSGARLCETGEQFSNSEWQGMSGTPACVKVSARKRSPTSLVC